MSTSFAREIHNLMFLTFYAVAHDYLCIQNEDSDKEKKKRRKDHLPEVAKRVILAQPEDQSLP